MGVPSPSRFLRIDGRGDPGTCLSCSTPPLGSTGVIFAGLNVAGPRK